MERSRVAVSVLGLPLHPCKGFVYTVTTRQRCLKINQPKRQTKSALMAKAWAGCRKMRCLKGLKANLKPDQKDSHCNGIKTSQASPDHFRLLK